MSTKLEKIIEKNNLKYLRDFEVALTEEGLSDKTIRKHVENASFFINDFLNYYEPKTLDQGILELDYFFSEWFLRKAMWASKTAYKENMTSIKKFYKFLYKCKTISQEDYQDLEQIIKENKDKWMSLIEAFDAYFDDENDDYEDFDLEYDDISYFLDSGMLDEDEANGVLNDFFKVAKAILKEKPWTYLYETDVIEITVPDEDEKFFASVIGAGGESFGVILYQGTIGLKAFFRMLSDEGQNIEQISISQSYIALHFDGIQRFNPVDQAFLFGSQVSFEYDQKLPCLRSQEPGMIACPLELIELIDLEYVLSLLLKTFKYLKKHKDYRDWLAQDRIFKVEATETGEINYGFRDIEAILSEEFEVWVYLD